MYNAKPIPQILDSICLPDGLSMKMLADSSLPGSQYARYAVDAKRIPSQVVFMDRAITEYATAKGYDVVESKVLFLTVQCDMLMLM